MDRNDYTLFRRMMLSLLSIAMPCLAALATDVVVADANGNELTYSYDSADGPATFKGVKRYAQDAAKAGRIIIADAVTDANGVSHEVKYVSGGVGNRGNLVSIVFGRNIVATGGADGSSNDAFRNCQKLESVTLNAKLQTLGRYCFRDCKAMSSINLSAATSLTTIKYDCFENCDALVSVTLPASVTTLEDYAFYGCDALKEVKFSTSSKELTFGKEVFCKCKALASFTFPQNLAVMGEGTFDYCESLATVEFNGSPAALKTIPRNTFASCTGLKSITLPDVVEVLGVGVFYNCTSLTEVNFGKGLTSLGNDNTVLGSNMPNLKKLVFPGANYPFKRSHAMRTLDVTLYVHPDLVDTYRTSEYTKWYHTVAIGKTVSTSVTTSAGGQLESKVRAKADPLDLLELTVSGPLNGTDINFLHQHLWGLEKLDLSNARIVAGGDKYARWHWDNNKVNQYGNTLYSTEDNVVGNLMFYDMPCLQSLLLPSGTTAIGEYAVSQENAHGTRFRLTHCPIPSGVKSIAKAAFYYAGITEASIPKGVTVLPEYVFAYCQNLKKATLPDGLKSIGNSCFSECVTLEEVNMPSTVELIDQYAFNNNQKRTTPLVIPNVCKTIGNCAFRNNYVLPSVKFGNSVETIGSSAFAECHLIESAVLPETVKTVADRVFQNCDSLRTFTFPKNIKQVPSWFFEWCDGLTSVTLADGTTSIGESAFSTCISLKNINLTEQKSLTTIGRYAFYKTALTAVNLPNQITEIGTDAFRGGSELVSINVPTGIDYVPCAFVRECPKFTTIKMHNGIRTVKSWAFESCPALTSVELNDQITTIEEYAFYRATAFSLKQLPSAVTFLGHSAFRETAITGTLTLPTGLKTMQNCVFGGSTIGGIVIPEGMTGFGTDNFYGCKSLTSVKLPSDMVTVPNNTFRECTALESIDLPEGLTTIGYAAFCDAGLTSITLPESIKSIDSYAFERTKLTTFRVPDGFTNDMGSYSLQNCKQLRSVYFGRNQDYSQWSSFTCVYGCDSLQLMRVYAGVPPKSDKSSSKNFRFNCVLEVPEDQVQLYKEAEFWKDFKEIRGIFMGDILADRDFALMQELYDKFDGANWTKPWDLSNNHHAVGKWAGITTVHTGGTNSQTYCISAIDLSGLGLKGTLPASLFRLTELTKLNLSNNQLEGDLTTIISSQNAAPLTEVNLQGNRLTGDIYPFASKLPELTKLDLSYNLLTDISQPVSKEKLANNKFVYNYQFIDYTTRQAVVPEGAPVTDITVGVPATIEMNHLIAYRHNNQDYGFTSRDLGRIYYNNNGWNVDWELYQTDGLWDLYQNDGDHYRTLKAKKGEPTPYSYNTSDWKTILLRFTWVDGDVNTDQTVDVQDLQSVIHYALNDRKPKNLPFNFGAADDNSDDKVNVIDITRSVAYVLSNRRSAPANARGNNMVREGSQNLLYCVGSNLSLTNTDEVAAMQFDVMGASLRDIRVGADIASRFSVAMDNVPGGVRVVLYSPTGNALPAGTHKLMMQLPAGATVGEAVLTNKEARRLSVSVDGEVSTTIDELGIDPSADLPIFDLGGRQLGPWNTLPAGIYVVRKQGQSYLLRK